MGIISLVGALYFIIPPVHSFAFRPDTLAVVLAFIVVGALIVEGAAWLRLAETDSYKYASLVETSDDAIYMKSLDETILTWNRGAERLYGYAAHEMIGRSVSVLVPPDRVDELADVMSRLRRGGRLEPFETVRLKKDGTPVDVSLSISPVTDSAGWIVGASMLARDISDRKRAERQQRFLVEANQVLMASLDVQASLDALAALVVPAMVDWCTIELVKEGSPSYTTVMHQDPGKTARARDAHQTYAHRPDAQIPWVVRTGRPALFPEITPDAVAALVPDATLRDFIGGSALRSGLAVPLVARGRTLGALSFFSAESARRYDQHDLWFAEQLGRHAALALDNAWLHQAEHAARRGAERLASRLGRLQSLTQALSEALTPEQVAEAILHHVVEDLDAGAAAVLLRGDDERSLELLSAVGYSPETHARWQRAPEEIRPIALAMRTRQVVWFPSWDDFRARYPQAIAPSEPARQGARAAVPLMLRGRPLGALHMNFKETREFTAEDLEFLMTLGRQCAQAIDRARLYAREHQIATTLQRALLPSELPPVPGVDIRATYLAAAAASDVGGDWYDVFRLPDGCVALSVGDVVGHGIEAASTMGEVRHAIRTAVLEGHDPGSALAVASKVLQLRRDKGMATAVVGVLDPAVGTFTYASAGHPSPIIATNGQIEMLESGGPPMGLLDQLAVPLARAFLPYGALLVLYTDGLVEDARDYVRGEAELLSAIQHEHASGSPNPAQSILERVVSGRQVPDDIAIVAVRLGPRPVEAIDVTLPAEVTSLAHTRRMLERLAQDLGFDEARTAAMQVAVGEAATNAIQHAYGAMPGTVRLRARTEGRFLQVEVEDAGRWRPARAGAGGVHGLELMRALADAVDIASTEHGTTVRLAFAMA